MTDAHAVYAPSSAHRWSNCTASAEAIAALERVVPPEEGEAAQEGTEAHEEIERCLAPVPQLGGEPMDVNPDHPAAYGVSLLLDYVKQLPPGDLWVEQRVELTPAIWGRCDVAHFDRATETLTIVDYKNGYVDVQAEENEQLQIYAAASLYTHNLPAKWIRLVVVQPNSIMPVPRVKQWVTSADALFAFATRVAGIPKGAKEFKAGEHCRYCPLFGRCEASKDVLARLATMLMHGPQEVTPDQASMFIATRKPIEDWFKALDKSLMQKAMTGTKIPGMKLVATTKHRDWKDPAEARKIVVATVGEDALDLCTPAQAEKLGMAEAAVAKLAIKPDGGPALAFESDKRPTFERKSVEKMFEAVTTTSK